MPRRGARTSKEPGDVSQSSLGRPVATQKVVAYAALTGIGLLAAVVLGEVGVVALAGPFAFALVIGLLSPVPPMPVVRAALDQYRIVEGDSATVSIELSAAVPVPECNVAIAVPRGLRAEGPTDWSLRLEAASPELIEVRVKANRYGRFVIDPVVISVPGRFGLLARFGSGGTDALAAVGQNRADARQRDL